MDVNEIIASPSSIDLTTFSVKQNKSKYPLKEAGNFFYKFQVFWQGLYRNFVGIRSLNIKI